MRMLLARLALVLAGLTLVLTIAELGAWWLSSQRPVSAPRLVPPEWKELPRLKEGLVDFSRPKRRRVQDRFLDLRRPRLRGIYRGALLENNGAGFRGPDRTLEKPRGVFRVVVIGDSVTMGSGVVYEDTYAAKLEPTLAKDPRLVGQSVQVLNIGLSGINARYIVDRLEKLGLHYDPDLIVYGYTLNDIEGRSYRRSHVDNFGHSGSFRNSRSYLWRLLGPRVNALREMLGSPHGSYRHELDDNYFENDEAWGQVSRALDRLSEVARPRNLCVVMLVHTHLFSLGPLHPFRRHYAAVAEAGRDRDFLVVESWPHFRGLDPPSLWTSPVDSHPNPRGHLILHDALVEGLRDLPSRCWNPLSSQEPGRD